MLHRHLGNVGKITSYFFLIQDEFYKKYNDTDKFKKYHNKLINDSIEFDYDGIIKFIENVLNTHGDHEFQALVETVKFWK